MNARPQQNELVTKQAIAMVHWDSPDEEVFAWLENDLGITGAEAEQILAEAHQARTKAVRAKALVSFVFSMVGLGLVLGYFGIQAVGRFVLVGPAVFAVVVVGAASAFGVLVSGWQLLTGRKSGPV